MSFPEKVDHVSGRLLKLGPKKRDGVVRSIEAMFQFTGGLQKGEVERLILAMEKKKLFSISKDGKVTYHKV